MTAETGDANALRRLRIGLIASEFPPAIGGMESLASGLAIALSATDDVTVYVRPGYGLSGAPFQQVSGLVGELQTDTALLRQQSVDVWLALNAGYVPLANGLTAPFCSYLIGNDFLAPWIDDRRQWAHSLAALPVVWRFANAASSWERRRGIREGLARVAHIFVISSAMADLMAEKYPGHAAKTSLVPPGVDDIFFQPLALRSSNSGVRLISVSRLSRSASRKNIDGTIRAVSSLPANFPVRYTIVGDGDDRSRLQALAEELQCSDRVRFLGSVDQQRLLKAYREADLLILASKASATDVEGFGIVYLEASAAGVPVMASRAGMATDAVRDGENGILLESSEPDAIARGIVRFQQERERFSPSRVQAFAERFRWTRVAAAVRSALSKAAG